jgi:hypothetical protein
MGPEEEVMMFLFAMALISIPILAIIKSKKSSTSIDQKRVSELEGRVTKLENELSDNTRIMNDMKSTVQFVQNLLEDKTKNR